MNNNSKKWKMIWGDVPKQGKENNDFVKIHFASKCNRVGKVKAGHFSLGIILIYLFVVCLSV